MAESEAVGEAPPEAAAAGSDSGRLPTLREALLAFGHLTVLSTFALAQPLFSLLSDNPEFFAARGSTPADIIVFSVLLVFLPPLALLGLELLFGLAGPLVRRIVHLVLVALLAAVIFVQALKDALGSSDVLLVGVALALGAIAAALYARAEPVRSFMTVLTPAPLVFLVIFLFISPVSKITLADEAAAKSVGNVARVPVVMIVFDEFPSTSLMDARRHIDAERYPGFARLARDSTWFRNAHSVYDSTTRAVPAIMDGNYPEKDTLPTSSEHPNSIFALLGKTHRMNVSEEATTVCPSDLCTDSRTEEPFLDRLSSMTDDLSLVYAHVVAPPGVERDLASVSENWGNFGGDAGGGSTTAAVPSAEEAQTRANLNGNRRQRFEAWTDAIQPGRRPALNFKHALLPHVPWQYLPNGQLYRRQADDPVSNLSRQSYEDEGQVEQLQMRHLLQLGFADLEIQRLIKHLKDTGTYDDSLIVVTADHGVSFKQGQFDRRNVNEENIDEISPVPLFVKRPDQKKGRIDDSIVETTDILPTIADVLGIELPDEADGRSAFGARGAQARRGEDAQARPVRVDPRGRRRVRSPQGGGVGQEGAPLRHGHGRPRPDLPHRAQPGPDRDVSCRTGNRRRFRGQGQSRRPGGSGRRRSRRRLRADLDRRQGVGRIGRQARRGGLGERHDPRGGQLLRAGHRGRRAHLRDAPPERPGGGEERSGGLRDDERFGAEADGG